MKKKLYVGSLPFSVNDAELANIFSAHGTVTSARVVIDRVSGRSKGFGFVEYEADDSAQKAIEALNDAEISGRKIVVNEAREQAPRTGGGGGRGFGGGGGGRGGPRGGGGGGRGFGGGGGRDRGGYGGGGDRY